MRLSDANHHFAVKPIRNRFGQCAHCFCKALPHIDICATQFRHIYRNSTKNSCKIGVCMHSMSDEAIDVFVCLNMGSKRERKNERKKKQKQKKHILRLPIECGRSIWLFTCYILQMNSSTQFLANMWLLRTCNPTY